jgi:hypothetical protein
MMRRRTFIAGLAAWPVAAGAQQSGVLVVGLQKVPAIID